MTATWRRIGAAAALVALFPSVAAAGGKAAEAVVLVADSRGMPAWKAWWSNLYNESHALFAVATVIIIPILGVVLGLAANRAMTMIGIDLSSRDLAEH